MIPSEFMLGARTWKVRWVTNKTMKKHTGGVKAWGLCCPAEAIIRLNKELLEMDVVFMLHTWEHELYHAIKFAYGQDQHCEVEVDGIAGLRTQYELSKKMAPEWGPSEDVS